MGSLTLGQQLTDIASFVEDGPTQKVAKTFLGPCLVSTVILGENSSADPDNRAETAVFGVGVDGEVDYNDLEMQRGPTEHAQAQHDAMVAKWQAKLAGGAR